ncbi:hypothetical protein Tco_0986697, partial [Tanacetum coccineum]
EGYTEEIVHDFEQGLGTIFKRQVNRVHILDFEGLTLDMRQDLAERLRIVYTKDDGKEKFILEFFSTCKIGSFHTAKEMAEDGFRAYWLGSERVILYKGDLSYYWVEISSGMDFLRGDPSYTYIRYPFRSLCHRLISYNIFGRGQAPEKMTATDLFYLRSMDRGAANIPYLLAQYLFRHAEGKKSSARLFGGHFIGRLAHHFGLPDVVGGAPRAVKGAPTVDEGALADPAPVQAPQPPPPPPTTRRTMP